MYWPAAAGDLAWRHVEPSVAVIGVMRADALALGSSYGQEAIFELSSCFMTVLGWRNGRMLTTGWRIDPLQAGHPEACRADAGREVAGNRWKSAGSEPTSTPESGA